jgi:hypothetical protein
MLQRLVEAGRHRGEDRARAVVIRQCAAAALASGVRALAPGTPHGRRDGLREICLAHSVGSRWPLRRHSGAKPPGQAHQGNTDLGADAPAAAYHSFVRFMRIVSPLCSVQVSNELGTGTVRVLHTLRPFAVAMAGAGEFDPWKDLEGLKRCKHDMEPT